MTPLMRAAGSCLFVAFLTACGGKYLIKSYPSNAKLYLKDMRTNEKKLIGSTPVQISEDPKLGDVFFLLLEKDNYKPKEVMVKVNEGESFTIAARMDPLLPSEQGDAAESGKGDDNKPQQQGGPKKDEEPKNWQKEVDELKLRIALLETTTAFTKDALFSPRMIGGVPSFDRDRRESVVSYVFQAQSAIQVGKYQEALAHIDRAIELDEYSANAWLLKGSVKYQLKDFPGAKLAWERTLKLDPYNKTALAYLNKVYKNLSEETLPANPDEIRAPAAVKSISRRKKKN